MYELGHVCFPWTHVLNRPWAAFLKPNMSVCGMFMAAHLLILMLCGPSALIRDQLEMGYLLGTICG